MSVVAAKPQTAFATAFERDVSNGRSIYNDTEGSSGRQIDLPDPNLKLRAAAVQFVLCKTAGQNAVDCSSGQTGE